MDFGNIKLSFTKYDGNFKNATRAQTLSNVPQRLVICAYVECDSQRSIANATSYIFSPFLVKALPI
jgi:hypothetical protein